MSPKKGETAVHCCNPALSVLVMLVPRNVIHVVSALQSIVCLYTFFWLIRSLVDPRLAAFIVCGPLQFLVSDISTLTLPAVSSIHPHFPAQPTSHLSYRIYLHYLHLIYPPHIDLHSLNLIYPPDSAAK